jgi:glycosyltransferase involved in cell wall biosynthesis
MRPDDYYPLVTVIMPIRNEAAYIRRSLGAVLAQDYPPERMEVLVVDGMSVDGTREAVEELASTHPHISVRLLDNPACITPAAFNIGLRHARGEVIILVGGHCEIAPDYVRRCVEILERTGADCVGGPVVPVGESFTARAIALAQSSLFGVGSVPFRTRMNYAGYVDTVPFGAYRRQVFDRVGLFDEELVGGEDDEFNFRLKQSGGRIWLDPSIRSVYYTRRDLRGFWRQYFRYGFCKVRVIQKRRGIPSWRHLVPGAFVLGLGGSVLLALLTHQPLWALSVALPYAVANGVASLWAARRDWKVLPLLPAAFATLHLAYGLGFLWGLLWWGVISWPKARKQSVADARERTNG